MLEVATHLPWVCRQAEAAGHEVVVANPWSLAFIYGNAWKSDRRDAELLARVGRMNRCLEEYDRSGNLLRKYVYGQEIDEIRMMIAPDVADVDEDGDTTELKEFYYHHNMLGSVTQITDPDENVVEQYEYTPYGRVTIEDGDGTDLNGVSAIGNPYMFTARRYDEETGLYHYRRRAYDPETGRFLQRDPFWHRDGPNKYLYVRDVPTSLVDPLGLEPTLKGPYWSPDRPSDYPVLPPPPPLPPPKPRVRIGCPKKAPQKTRVGDGWCYCPWGSSNEGKNRMVFRGLGKNSGLECIYESDGSFNRRAGDRVGPKGEHTTGHKAGDCWFGAWRGFWHVVLDWLPSKPPLKWIVRPWPDPPDYSDPYWSKPRYTK